MPPLSVLMPTYNRASYLKWTLEGFAQQTVQDWELVLVDDGSTDNTEEVVDAFKDRLNIRYLKQNNQGRSAARNYACSQARGPIWVFSDDDRIPAPEFIEEHLKTLGSDEKKISVGQKKEILTHYSEAFQLPWDNHLLALFSRNPELSLKRMPKALTCLITEEEFRDNFEAVVTRLHYKNSPDNFDEVVAHYGEELENFLFGWVLCTTGNAALHRPPKGTEIGFDENYTGWGMEDTDFAYQLVSAGYTVQCSPKARNFHQLHPRSPTEPDEMRKNLKLFCEKHSGEQDLFGLTQKPGANLLSLFVRFVQRDYTLAALNQIAVELKASKPHMFLKDYLRLSRARALHILREPV